MQKQSKPRLVRSKSKSKAVTLDIRRNALRSIHFLENGVDSKRKNLPYFRIDFAANPPEFMHAIHFDDPENIARWYYAIVCAQLVAGSSAGEKLHRSMLKEVERRLTGPFGFMYTSEYSSQYSPKAKEPYSWLWGDRSALQGWVLDWMRVGSKRERSYFETRIRNMVQGLDEFCVRQGKYIFFPTYTPGISYKKATGMKLPEEREEIWDAMYKFNEGVTGTLPPPGDSLGGMIFPLVQWYEASGDLKALAIANGISNTIVDFHTLIDNKVNPVGCMSNNHGTLNAMAGVLAAARHSHDRRHVAWARMLFEFYWSRCSSSFGWVTENENVNLAHPLERPSCEGCATIDLVCVAIELAKAGFLECWDIVERVTRNYMTQAQVTHIGRISLRGVALNTFNRNFEKMTLPELRDSRNVAERAVGCMAGWGAPNDILDPRGRVAMCVQNCCSAHLPFGLYRVWAHIAEMREGKLRVNLALNHDCKLCHITDFQPFEGRLDIEVKQTAELLVRLPEWVEKDKVEARVQGLKINARWDDSKRYLELGSLRVGSKVSILYPLRQWRVTEWLGGTAYTTEWAGDTVISIDPPGKYIPIFNSI